MNMIAPRRARLVLVGNGMAGVRAAGGNPQRAPRTHSPSPCSAPSRTATTTASCCRRCWPARRRSTRSSPIPRSWYEHNGIELIAGEAVVGDRPRGADGHRRARHHAALRRAAAGHRLEPGDHPAAGPQAAGRHQLPRHRRRRNHDAGRQQGRHAMPSSSAAACWGWKRPTAWRATAWTPPCCTSCRR